MSEFSDLVPNAVQFFNELKANNNREWFQAHKKAYETAVKNPANALGAMIATGLEKNNAGPVTYKLFRINRDVRFSKDKTPYNTHLHLLWNDGSGPGWFFGVSPDYVTAGCGVMGLQKQSLDKYRKFVDQNGERVALVIEKHAKAGARMDPPELKRVPAPYSKDHPQAEILKRKSFTVWHDFSEKVISEDALLGVFAKLGDIAEICREFSA